MVFEMFKETMENVKRSRKLSGKPQGEGRYISKKDFLNGCGAFSRMILQRRLRARCEPSGICRMAAPRSSSMGMNIRSLIRIFLRGWSNAPAELRARRAAILNGAGS